MTDQSTRAFRLSLQPANKEEEECSTFPYLFEGALYPINEN
jgi:hypothetical protein